MLHFFGLGNSTPNEPVYLTALKVVRLDLVTSKTFRYTLALLAQCQGLRDCEISVEGCMSAQDKVTMPTTLKDITGFTILSGPRVDWDFLLNSLSAPRIEQLSLEVSGSAVGGVEEIPSVVTEFVERHGCDLVTYPATA